MGIFDWVRSKAAPEMEVTPEPEQESKRPEGEFSTHLLGNQFDREQYFDNAFKQPSFTNPDTKQPYAMDAQDDANNPYATKNAFVLATQRIPDSLMYWYGNQGFIGYQSCAMMAQNWLIYKACNMPAKDAARNGWKPTINDGQDESAELIDQICELDKKFRVKKNLIEFVTFKRIFGIRIALFVVESDDADYYLKPFNPDGIKEGSYKGISQVDPYWMTPYMGEDSIQDPAGVHFYEPTWWQIGGKRYHRTHLIISRHSEVADIIKPSYLYGGVPLTQQIFERIYAAERTANEAPLLAMTKRMNIQKVDLQAAFQNPERFMMRNLQAAQLRDSFGVKFINNDEDYVQHETSLADLDAVIMTQYQLVAAIAEVPATKLLGTSPKGFGASGDYEIDSYHELLAGLQATDMEPILERHYEILSRSELGGKYHITPVWNPLDEPTEEEIANINKTKAETYTALQNTGAVDGQDIRDVLVKDPQSGFGGMTDAAPEEIEDDDGGDDGGGGGMDSRWVTVKPNGPDEKGTPALISESGVVEAGMGGKFNGKKISNLKGEKPDAKEMPKTAQAHHISGITSEIKERKTKLSEFKAHLKKTGGQVMAGHPAITKMEEEIAEIKTLADRYNTRQRLASISPDDPKIKESLKKDFEAIESLANKHSQPNAEASAKKLDHGELNIPGRTKNINRDLDRYKKEQSAQQEAERKVASSNTKSNKAEAKQLLETHLPAILKKHGAKFGEKNLREHLTSQSKWEPEKLIKFVNKFLEETK